MDGEIFEASLDPKNVAQVRGDKKIGSSIGAVPAGHSRLKAKAFDMGRVWSLLDGAIDIHIHSDPCAYGTKMHDELDLSIQACEVGMKAVVFKCNSTPSARSAYMVQKVVNRWAEERGKKRIDVFGGVVLNNSVGGLNPEAVIVSYKIGGRMVWLPTKDASFHHRVMGTPGGIEVLDEKGKVVPALKEIFGLIAEGDMVLALGHQSTKERFVIIDEAKKAGVKKIEVVHPNQAIGKMTVEQMKIAAHNGAYIGLYCTSFRPLQWSWEGFLEATRVVGCDRIIAATDCGHFAGPTPVDSMRQFISGMLMEGVPDTDVEKMVKINPGALVY